MIEVMLLTVFVQDMGKRTPSTSAIYETLRRSKELRESLSRPGSRMSMDNIPDKLKEPVSAHRNLTHCQLLICRSTHTFILSNLIYFI